MKVHIDDVWFYKLVRLCVVTIMVSAQLINGYFLDNDMPLSGGGGGGGGSGGSGRHRSKGSLLLRGEFLQSLSFSPSPFLLPPSCHPAD